MNAFISYSHRDQGYLDMFQKHLAQVKRDGLLDAWTDHAIEAGGSFNEEIEGALIKADIFIALISPDYIGSNYCYEKEFKTAQELLDNGKIKIIPIIVEPCDWHNTPFAKLKALPKDGKAVAHWSNPNTAFLNVITEIRKLLSKTPSSGDFMKSTGSDNSSSKYRAQKDFDSIEKMDFVKKAYDEIRSKITENIKEVIEVDGIKAKILENSSETFKCILVNKNKLGVETTLIISKSDQGVQRRNMMMQTSSTNFLRFEILGSRQGQNSIFYELDYDDFHLFWKEGGYHHSGKSKEVDVSGIVDSVWIDWLHSVGIEF